jgi:hypothetical protein
MHAYRLRLSIKNGKNLLVKNYLFIKLKPKCAFCFDLHEEVPPPLETSSPV